MNKVNNRKLSIIQFYTVVSCSMHGTNFVLFHIAISLITDTNTS